MINQLKHSPKANQILYTHSLESKNLKLSILNINDNGNRFW